MLPMKNFLAEIFKPNSADDASNLTWLQHWCLSQCDGDWEHGFGVHIETLDNPGWIVKINLIGTELEGQRFDRIKIERSEQDWILSWVEEDIFKCASGPLNLDESLSFFRTW